MTLETNLTTAFELIGTDMKITRALGDAAGAAFADGLESKLLANGGVEGGNAGLTTLFVLNTTDGKAQITSLEDGNEVVSYLSGPNFAAGIIVERVFLKKGEIYILEGLQNGSVITSSTGAYGYSGQRSGGNMSPMPLGCLAFQFADTFFFAFRNSSNGNSDRGLIFVSNGPIESTVQLRTGAGAVVDSQADVTLAPYGFHIFHTLGNQEYRLQATQPVVAGITARMTDFTGQTGSFYDSRGIMPLTAFGLTWPRNGDMSALYDSTPVEYFVRDGASGNFTVSPGSPYDMNQTGANDADYEPNGATIFKANGFITGYSGADSAGLEASPLWPLSAACQRVALPLKIRDAGDGGNNGIAIASEFEGTAKIYEWDPVLEEAVLVYTVPLNRGITTTTREDQRHPAAALVSASAGESTVELSGDFYGGYVEADVPIIVVFNSEQNQTSPYTADTRKGTSGPAVVAIAANDDEQTSTGITPKYIRAEIREDENGLRRKRVVDASGAESWVIA